MILRTDRVQCLGFRVFHQNTQKLCHVKSKVCGEKHIYTLEDFMSILTGTEKYISVIYNQIFGWRCNARQRLSIVTPASKKAVRKIASKKSQRLSLLSSSFSAIWVIPLSLWLFSVACSTEAIPCNEDTTADPEYDCLPFPPGNLDIKDLGLTPSPPSMKHDYLVEWEDMEGAEKYEMTKICQAERVKLSDINWGQTSNDSITDSEYKLSAMEPGDVCYVRVRTCDQFGCGRWIEREFRLGPQGAVASYPIIITSYAQLKTIKNDLSKHYRLGNDIDASASWNEDDSSATTCVAYNGSNGATATCKGFMPIGNDTTRFTGSFDGAGHKITKLYIKRPTTIGVGLFGYTASSAEIKNIGVTDAYVVGKDSVGGLIGSSTGSVSNSYATGAVTGDDYVGGLVGGGGTVSNSYATGAVMGTGSAIGGLVGGGGRVRNSYATGNVTGSGTYTILNNTAGVGGLIGAATSGSSVMNSYATGDVMGMGNNVGGFIGWAASASSVMNSYATGDVMRTTGTSNFIGGLIGLLAGSVITGENYFVDAYGGTNGLGSGTCSGTCTRKTAVEIAGLTSTSGWTTGATGNWNFGTTSQLPTVLYSGGGCETIATNNVNSNDGDVKIPDCGDVIKGQR